MTDLLSGVNEQLSMGIGEPEVIRTPMYGSGERQTYQPDQANFYRVTCNAGAFLVRASNEAWVDLNLEEGLKLPLSVERVSHGTQGRAERSLHEVFKLQDIDFSTVRTEQVVGALATHFSAIDMPLVTYLGSTASTSSE